MTQDEGVSPTMKRINVRKPEVKRLAGSATTGHFVP
jgi:hypothetical protein